MIPSGRKTHDAGLEVRGQNTPVGSNLQLEPAEQVMGKGGKCNEHKYKR
jgi:hypothetical protein